MQYMVIITANDAEDARLSPRQLRLWVDAHAEYERWLGAAFVDGARFRPSDEAVRVSATGIERGPFGAMPLAGYYMIDATDLHAAIDLAHGCPMPVGTWVEVRPVMKALIKADKQSVPGRIFALAVLGKAETEAAWIEIMDRIEADTRDTVPALGGARLNAPALGRTVTSGSSSGWTAMPFLEGREVIGGILFMAATTIETAIEWARASEFMKHGTLEIRELWRS